MRRVAAGTLSRRLHYFSTTGVYARRLQCTEEDSRQERTTTLSIA